MRPIPRPVKKLRLQRSELEEHLQLMIHGSRDRSNGLVIFPRSQMIDDLLDDLIRPAPGGHILFSGHNYSRNQSGPRRREGLNGSEETAPQLYIIRRPLRSNRRRKRLSLDLKGGYPS